MLLICPVSVAFVQCLCWLQWYAVVVLSVDQVEVMEVAIDKTGSAVERRLIFVDKNRDMFMTQVRVYGTARKTIKLCKYLTLFMLSMHWTCSLLHSNLRLSCFSFRMLVLLYMMDAFKCRLVVGHTFFSCGSFENYRVSCFVWDFIALWDMLDTVIDTEI